MVQTMNQTEKDLFILLQNGLSDSDRPISSDFDDVATLSKAHLCGPLVYMGYKKLGKTIPDDFKSFITFTFIHNQLNMDVQNEIVATFNSFDGSAAICFLNSL